MMRQKLVSLFLFSLSASAGVQGYLGGTDHFYISTGVETADMISSIGSSSYQAGGDALKMNWNLLFSGKYILHAQTALRLYIPVSEETEVSILRSSLF